MPKQINSRLFPWLNKQPDLKKGQHSFMLFYVVYKWRTLPPFQLQTVFWGAVFPSGNSLFIQICKKINISEFVLPSYFFITLFNSFFVLLFFIVFHLAAVVRNVPVCGTIREFWFWLIQFWGWISSQKPHSAPLKIFLLVLWTVKYSNSLEYCTGLDWYMCTFIWISSHEF